MREVETDRGGVHELLADFGRPEDQQNLRCIETLTLSC